MNLPLLQSLYSCFTYYSLFNSCLFLAFSLAYRKTLKPLACPCSAPSSIFPNSLCSLGLAEYLPYSGLLISGEEQEQDFEDGAED